MEFEKNIAKLTLENTNNRKEHSEQIETFTQEHKEQIKKFAQEVSSFEISWHVPKPTVRFRQTRKIHSGT